MLISVWSSTVSPYDQMPSEAKIGEERKGGRNLETESGALDLPPGFSKFMCPSAMAHGSKWTSFGKHGGDSSWKSIDGRSKSIGQTFGRSLSACYLANGRGPSWGLLQGPPEISGASIWGGLSGAAGSMSVEHAAMKHWASFYMKELKKGWVNRCSHAGTFLE